MTTKKTILRFTKLAWRAICTHHRNKGPVERASVALGHSIVHGDRQIILLDVPGLALMEDSDYAHQHGGAVQVKPEVTRHLMWWLAQSEYDTFISIHDHWFAKRGTTFSGGDDRDDITQDQYFRSVLEPQLRMGPFGKARELTHISLVLDQNSMDARLVDSSTKSHFATINSVQVLGTGLDLMIPNSHAADRVAPDEVNARHRDFLSPTVRQTLAGLRVGIVGCGGIGSILAENLLRLGIREFALFDPDTLETTNLNRWLGARRSDVGKPKVDLLAANLIGCEPSARVQTIRGDVIDVRPTDAIGSCDVLIGTVDNDAARYWLNRVACATLVPLFDLGVRIRTQPRIDFLTRIVPVLPGQTACLECSAIGLLDRLEVAKRFDGLTARARKSAGYVSDAPASSPSVMGLNTQVAGAAVLEFLAFISGWHRVSRLKTSTWSTGAVVAVQEDCHLPDPKCPACGPDALAKGAMGCIPVPTPAEATFDALRELFDVH